MILGKGSNTKKASCFAISLIILSSIVTNILILNVSGYTAATTASAEISNSNSSYHHQIQTSMAAVPISIIMIILLLMHLKNTNNNYLRHHEHTSIL